MIYTLETLEAACGNCRGCDLHNAAKNYVFGVGKADAEVMFVGEAPGEMEDRYGVPFVGPAGELLDDMLAMIGLYRNDVYIANILKCRPPANRDPLPDEQQACRKWLDKQIELIRPKIIVCLGRIAAKALINPDFRITGDHGRWFDVDGRRIMALYHPSALLRDESKRPDTFTDLRTLRKEIRAICTSTYKTNA